MIDFNYDNAIRLVDRVGENSGARLALTSELNRAKEIRECFNLVTRSLIRLLADNHPTEDSASRSIDMDIGDLEGAAKALGIEWPWKIDLTDLRNAIQNLLHDMNSFVEHLEKMDMHINEYENGGTTTTVLRNDILDLNEWDEWASRLDEYIPEKLC